MIAGLLGIAAAYVLGSVPWAYIAGRALKGIDLREHGSGNLGATNVLRVLGLPAAIAVLVLDAAKGAAPVLLLPSLTGARPSEWWAPAFALASVVGHVRPVFLGWRGGGKGVATAAGAFAVLTPVPLAVAFAAFAVVLAATRVMSLGSLTGATVLPLAVAFTYGVGDPRLILAALVTAFVFWNHRANIDRLRRGVEPRLGRKTPV